MEDNAIIEMFTQRNESAIAETDKKYGRYCHRIAFNILYSKEDADECVNDTYLKTWNAIPPHKPTVFSAFLAKITRSTAIDRYLHDRAKKRNSYAELALDELSECIPDVDSDDITSELILKNAINSFLSALPSKTRIIFMRRYWYLCSVKDIAEDLGMSESNVKVNLMRTRAKFKAHLEKEGIII